MNINVQSTQSSNNKTSIFTFIIAIYFLSLPFGTLNLGEFGSALRYIGFLVILGWILFSKKIRLNKIVITEILLSVLFFMSIIISIDFNESISRNVTNISFLLLIFSISGCETNEKNKNLLIRSAIWASRITALFVIIFGDIYKGSGRISLSGIFIEDPNYLTGYFIFGFVFALTRVIRSKMTMVKILSLLEIVLYLYLVLLTGSRTGFITYMVVTIFMLLFSTKFKYKQIFRLLFFMILYLIIIEVASEFISNEILYRFTLESIIESEGTGRYDLWVNALKIFQNSSIYRMFFGYGIGSIKNVYFSFGYNPEVVHNIFIEVLLENGLLGLIIYSYLIYLLIKTSVKFPDKMLFFVLIGMIIMSLAASLYSFKPYWNIILLIIYMLNFESRKITINKYVS